MADDSPVVSGALPDPSPTDHTNATFSPIQFQRRDTATSIGSEKIDTCRICRSEGTPDEPLFYPCKCSGSIKFVHQECLMEWLSHSNKKHCELCKTAFRFTKLYDANMPQKLPWRVFAKRACWHVVQMFGRGCRALLVGMVWLGLVPWLIRWVWRWFFWIADAAWARDAFIDMMQSSTSDATGGQTLSDSLLSGEMRNADMISNALQQLFGFEGLFSRKDGPFVYSFANALAKSMGYSADNATSASTLPQADASILSSWSYVASLTPHDRINRIILDVFEGQIITCVVIVGFILVFLIREWVVQQQPLVNLDNVQQQFREAADRVQADNERLRQQQELLDQARRQLAELQNEAGTQIAAADEVLQATRTDFVGWEAIEKMIDEATEHLRNEGAGERANFRSRAEEVTKQIRAAGVEDDVNMDDFTEKVYEKLATYTPDERKEWEAVLMSEIDKILRGRALRYQIDDQSRDLVIDSTGSIEDTRASLPPTTEGGSLPGSTVAERVLIPIGDTPNVTSSDGQRSTSHVSSGGLLDETFAVDSTKSTKTEPEAGQKHNPKVSGTFEPMPITNAGPDAKINIKRSGKGKMTAVPEPKIEEKMLAKDALMRKLEDEVNRELEEKAKKPSEENSSDPALRQDDQEGRASIDNPFHPDGPEPETSNNESFSSRVASAFREEFGFDDAEEFEILRPPPRRPNADQQENDGQVEESQLHQPVDVPPSYFQRVADWLWGDIQTRPAEEPVPAPHEEVQQDDNGQEAPFVPIRDGEPDIPGFDQGAPAPQQQQPHHDPEVLAAAQQAGLDPDAIEDAEDLEGIFELIGLQGPFIGLFQTSAFCTLLVASTVIGAVVMPYLGGKIVLIVIGNPVHFLVKVPLQAASAMADFIIDLVLMGGGWLVTFTAWSVKILLAMAQKWIPRLGGAGFMESTMKHSAHVAQVSAARLVAIFGGPEIVDETSAEVLVLGWAFLGGSALAHASLNTIKAEVNAVFSFMGAVITWVVQTISSGSVSTVLKKSLHGLTKLPLLPSALRTSLRFLRQHTQTLIEFGNEIRKGALTISTPEIRLDEDPSLVYWNSTDRALAISTGYAALAALAFVYVAIDTPISRTESGRKTEKMIRDTLRQAGGVLKVILIISIEMLVFPLYCGLLLDVAFLPLFQGASLASRWEFAVRSPYLFCFLHWFIGTCYMFHFALFVGMCRKILRKGVLWFIRDPDDPTFHPVRDVLERNVATQLRKIAFSALVYGALVILCLGGVIWSIGRVFDGIFPIHWISTEPLLEFPLDLFLYNFVTPLIIRLFKPSDAVSSMYAWWLRRCARVLRLSHFLFDDRRKDEEGHFVHNSWMSLLLMKRPESGLRPSVPEDGDTTHENDQSEVYFERDGKYVLTPCSDQYRPPKPGEAFLHVDDDDVYIADKDGKKNEHFAKVYVPPLFRLRVTLFMMCLWLFSAFTGLCVTVLPLIFGRQLFASIVPARTVVNDIYAYSVGAYLLGGLMFLLIKSHSGMTYFREKTAHVDLKAWIEPTKRFTLRVLKCGYVYGFIGVALPTIFALLLQFYIILPLHTWFVSASASAATETQAANAMNATSSILTQKVKLPHLAQHTIHLLQDYALGLLYLRIAGRLIAAAPASRAAEAFRRITADGYLNPNVRLATRFFVLPVILITTLLLLLPPVTVSIAVTAMNMIAPSLALDRDSKIRLYRYSYPLAASCVVLVLGVSELGKATSRWRARIRDEVYLVGERLHNFGEKKPPVGSKSVARKEK